MSTSHQGLDGLCGAFLGISTVVIGLRFYARRLQKARWAADDWVMIPSYMLLVGLLATTLYGTYHRTFGYSTPVLEQHPVEPKLSISVNRAFDVFAAASTGCIKASALLFYKRIFCAKGSRDVFLYAIWVLLTFDILWILLYILMPIFQCGTVISHAWGPTSERLKWCTLSNPYLESQSVTSAVFDFLILALPVARIWGLKASLGRRIAVIAVFSTALVGLAASVAKAVIIFLIIDKKQDGDPQLASTRASFMWVLEACFAFVAINLPTLICLRNDKTPSRILSSVRSFISIRSQRRGSSEPSAAPAKNGVKLKDRASSSVADGERATFPDKHDMSLTPDNRVEHHASVLSSRTDSNQRVMADNDIHVTSSLGQSVDMV